MCRHACPISTFPIFLSIHEIQSLSISETREYRRKKGLMDRNELCSRWILRLIIRAYAPQTLLALFEYIAYAMQRLTV